MKINFIYFKDTGKFYAEGSCQLPSSAPFEGLYPREIGRQMNGKKMLPGLESGTWDGPFVCFPEEQYPELVLPE